MEGWTHNAPWQSLALLVAVLLPALGAALTARLPEERRRTRDHIALTAAGLTLVTVLVTGPAAWGEPVVYSWSLVAGLSRGLQMDGLSFIFAALGAGFFFLAQVYVPVYLPHMGRERLFTSTFLLTLSACMLIFLARDWLTLLLAFEAMTLISYLMVIHERSAAAIRAGNLYLYLGLGAGLAVLMGLFGVVQATGSTDLAPVAEGPIWLLALPMVVGFGIKAGMVPFHFWLPRAHPVAPSPASAILSGILIKTGVYGLLRTFLVLLWPQVAQGSPELASLGLFLVGLGFCSMFLGGIRALGQPGVKEVLAYSSVSQMGYIIIGVGTALLLGLHGVQPVAGVVLHVTNHAVLKVGLFLGAGMLAVHVHQLELKDYAGKSLALPWVRLLFGAGFLAMSGVPLLNSFTSKSLLFHGLEHAYYDTGWTVLFWAEWLFIVGGALTFVYYLRLNRLLFGSSPSLMQRSTWVAAREGRREKFIVLVVLAGALLLGLFPSRVASMFLSPALVQLGFPAGEVASDLTDFSFFSRANLLEAAMTLGIGLGLWFLFQGMQRLGQVAQEMAYLPAEKMPRGPLAFLCHLTIIIHGLRYRLDLVCETPGEALNWSMAFLCRVSGIYNRWQQRLTRGTGRLGQAAANSESGGQEILVSQEDSAVETVCHYCQLVENGLDSLYFSPGGWLKGRMDMLQTWGDRLARLLQRHIPDLHDDTGDRELPAFLQSLNFGPFVLAFVLVLLVVGLYLYALFAG